MGRRYGDPRYERDMANENRQNLSQEQQDRQHHQEEQYGKGIRNTQPDGIDKGPIGRAHTNQGH